MENQVNVWYEKWTGKCCLLSSMGFSPCGSKVCCYICMSPNLAVCDEDQLEVPTFDSEGFFLCTILWLCEDNYWSISCFPEGIASWVYSIQAFPCAKLQACWTSLALTEVGVRWRAKFFDCVKQFKIPISKRRNYKTNLTLLFVRKKYFWMSRSLH